MGHPRIHSCTAPCRSHPLRRSPNAVLRQRRRNDPPVARQPLGEPTWDISEGLANTRWSPLLCRHPTKLAGSATTCQNRLQPARCDHPQLRFYPHWKANATSSARDFGTSGHLVEPRADTNQHRTIGASTSGSGPNNRHGHHHAHDGTIPKAKNQTEQRHINLGTTETHRITQTKTHPDMTATKYSTRTMSNRTTRPSKKSRLEWTKLQIYKIYEPREQARGPSAWKRENCTSTLHAVYMQPIISPPIQAWPRTAEQSNRTITDPRL